MRRMQEEGMPHIRRVQFARDLTKEKGATLTFSQLTDEIPDWKEMLLMVDGLLVTEVGFVSYLDTLCTSGSGDKITSEKNAGPLPD